MRTTTRRMVTAAVAAAAVGVTSLAAAAPAQAAPSGPELLVKAVKAVRADAPTWVNAWWKTGRDICDVEVTATAWAADITYPSNTATYSSFSRGATLAKRTTDYTAFWIDAEAERSRIGRLNLTMTYTELAGDRLVPWSDNGDVDCRGPRRTLTTSAVMPVLG